jgi:hypothetical protein
MYNQVGQVLHSVRNVQRKLLDKKTVRIKAQHNAGL